MKNFLIITCFLFFGTAAQASVKAASPASQESTLVVQPYTSFTENVMKKKKRKRKRRKKKGLFKRIFKGKNQCDCPKH